MDSHEMYLKLLRSSTSLDVSNELDYINKLPDEILIHILDKLHIDDALNTPLLSKRWKSLWRHKRRIEIGVQWTQKTGKEVIPSLLRILDAYDGQKMESVSVSIRYDPSMRQGVLFLLAYGDLNVEELHIDFKDKIIDWKRRSRHYSLVVMPETDLEPCSSLVRLSLRSVQLQTLPLSRFKVLEQLFLDQVTLDADSVEYMTGSCPSLSLLCLTNCNPTSDLRIIISVNSNLLHLVIKEEFTQIVKKTKIFIQATGLKSVDFVLALPREAYHIRGILGCSDSATFMLDQMHRSRQAMRVYTTGMKGNFVPNVTELLRKLRTVGKLALSSWCIQAITIEVLWLKRRPVLDATHLVLRTGLTKWEFFGTCYTLLGCCKIKSLVIDLSAPAQVNFEYVDGWGMWGDHEPLKHVLKDLAVVEFRNNAGDYTWNDGRFLETPFFHGFKYGRLLAWNLRKYANNLRRLVYRTKTQVYETVGIQSFADLNCDHQVGQWDLAI